MKSYTITQEVDFSRVNAKFENAYVIANLSSSRKAVDAWRLIEFNMGQRYKNISPQVPATAYTGCVAEMVFDTGIALYRFRRWEHDTNALRDFPFEM